jgi:hypothetical protein
MTVAPREPLIASGVSFWNSSKNESLGSSLATPAVKLLAGALELLVRLPAAEDACAKEDADEAIYVSENASGVAEGWG